MISAIKLSTYVESFEPQVRRDILEDVLRAIYKMPGYEKDFDQLWDSINYRFTNEDEKAIKISIKNEIVSKQLTLGDLETAKAFWHDFKKLPLEEQKAKIVWLSGETAKNNKACIYLFAKMLMDGSIIDRNDRLAFLLLLSLYSQDKVIAQDCLEELCELVEGEVHHSIIRFMGEKAEQRVLEAQLKLESIAYRTAENRYPEWDRYDDRWCILAADEGIATAEAKVASYYYSKKDQSIRANALSWWLRGAKHGDPEAQHIVGCYYKLGDEVEKNIDQAIIWNLRSANQGNHWGQYELSFIFCYEREDRVEAYKWDLICCKSRGEPISKTLSKTIRQNVTEEEIKTATRMASVFQPQAEKFQYQYDNLEPYWNEALSLLDV